jgi:hypothetical protein
MGSINLIDAPVRISAVKLLIGVLIFILVWALLILFLTAQLSYDGTDWSKNLIISIKQSIPWILTSPLIILLALWFPLVHNRWWINTLLHISLCIFILLIVTQMRGAIAKNWPDPEETETTISLPTRVEKKIPLSPPYHSSSTEASSKTNPTDKETDKKETHIVTKVEVTQRIGRTAPLGVPLYTSIVLFISLLRYRQEIYRRDEAALRLETRLTQTQLDLLRSQLQPHFLFNTLNSISTLVHTDPDKADSMVIQLSNLLRCTLEQRDATFIPLEQEMATLQTYFNIQSTRFGDRIIIQTHIAPETAQLPVPPMILLPLAENAVRYGVEKSTKKTTIQIKSRIQSNQLVLSIIDDGPGIQASEKGGTGVGLTNTTNRLLTLYQKNKARVTLSENEQGLTEASITLPAIPPS